MVARCLSAPIALEDQLPRADGETDIMDLFEGSGNAWGSAAEQTKRGTAFETANPETSTFTLWGSSRGNFQTI